MICQVHVWNGRCSETRTGLILAWIFIALSGIVGWRIDCQQVTACSTSASVANRLPVRRFWSGLKTCKSVGLPHCLPALGMLCRSCYTPHTFWYCAQLSPASRKVRISPSFIMSTNMYGHNQHTFSEQSYWMANCFDPKLRSSSGRDARMWTHRH